MGAEVALQNHLRLNVPPQTVMEEKGTSDKYMIAALRKYIKMRPSLLAL